jgi:drug/metabolite transporter (DMT)-like permease
MLQMALRSGLSALLLGLLCWGRGERLSFRDGTWRPGLLAGVLFIGEGLRHTHASHIAIFLYTSPIFTALGLHWLMPAERLRRSQWAGIGVAFTGILLAFGGGWLQEHAREQQPALELELPPFGGDAPSRHVRVKSASCRVEGRG